MKNIVENKKIITRSKIFNEKSTKGITLIALVVTIVVLLILAGITINLVFSENGIIKKAQEAEKAQKEAIESDKQAIQDLTDELIRASGQYPLKDIIETAKALKARYDSGEELTIAEKNQGFFNLQNQINNSEYKEKLVNLEGTLVYVGNNEEEKSYMESQGINTELTSIIRNIGQGDPDLMYYEEGFIRITCCSKIDTEDTLKKLLVNSDDETEQSKITFEYPSDSITKAGTGSRVYYDGKYIGTLVVNADANEDYKVNARDLRYFQNIYRVYNKISEIADYEVYQIKVFDFDNDGYINDYDLEIFSNYLNSTQYQYIKNKSI